MKGTRLRLFRLTQTLQRDRSVVTGNVERSVLPGGGGGGEFFGTGTMQQQVNIRLTPARLSLGTVARTAWGESGRSQTDHPAVRIRRRTQLERPPGRHAVRGSN